MAISATAISRGTVTAIGVILLAVMIEAGSIGRSGLAEEVPAVTPAPVVAAGGVTLHSVGTNFPRSGGTFPGGRAADAINSDCLICHSAGMVLDQASLSRAAWQAEVEKMRDTYEAPFAKEDIPVIVDYLVNLKNVMAQTAGRQPDAKHGAVIVAQDTAAGAPPCAQCHAFNGVSDASGAFPRLAGSRPIILPRSCETYFAAEERDHVTDRQSAVVRRYCRCDGLFR